MYLLHLHLRISYIFKTYKHFIIDLYVKINIDKYIYIYKQCTYVIQVFINIV